jgi:hypothetical protein
MMTSGIITEASSSSAFPEFLPREKTSLADPGATEFGD